MLLNYDVDVPLATAVNGEVSNPRIISIYAGILKVYLNKRSQYFLSLSYFCMFTSFFFITTNINLPVLVPDGALPGKKGVCYKPSCVNC